MKAAVSKRGRRTHFDSSRARFSNRPRCLSEIQLLNIVPDYLSNAHAITLDAGIINEQPDARLVAGLTYRTESQISYLLIDTDSTGLSDVPNRRPRAHFVQSAIRKYRGKENQQEISCAVGELNCRSSKRSNSHGVSFANESRADGGGVGGRHS